MQTYEMSIQSHSEKAQVIVFREQFEYLVGREFHSTPRVELGFIYNKGVEPRLQRRKDT